MIEESQLNQKRRELKDQLSAGEYKTLIDLIFDGTGILITKLTPSSEPPSYWYSGTAIGLVTLLISFLTSILLGEFHPYREAGSILVLFQIWGVVQMVAGMIAIIIYRGILFDTLRDGLVDAIESEEDLCDLQHWLIELGNVKKPLYFSLLFGIVVSLYVVATYAASGFFVGFGPAVWTAIVFFPGGMILFFFFYQFLAFPIRLGRYHIKLNPVNPSSSEVVDHLSDTLAIAVYIAAVFLAVFTLSLFAFEIANLSYIVLLVLLGWGPLIALFLTNQYALARIITKAKWKKLNEVQAKIENLENQEGIPSEETIGHLNKLIDYYDRIRATRNSALDFRAGLNFVNSLLLPLLAFVLGNLNSIVASFK